MKIYTKKGDKGETSLLGGQKVRKDDLRVECYGTVDELNSFLGLAVTEVVDSSVKYVLNIIQNDLFVLGGELADHEKNFEDKNKEKIDDEKVNFLELKIDHYEEKLIPLKQFILPGGSKSASLLHVSRSICRRSERLVVKLSKLNEINGIIIIYLNRLSDLLFVLARFENDVNRIPDIHWKSK